MTLSGDLAGFTKLICFLGSVGYLRYLETSRKSHSLNALFATKAFCNGGDKKGLSQTTLFL